MTITRKGFRWNPDGGSVTGSGELDLFVDNSDAALPRYVFDPTGRISTQTAAGAALSFPTTYLRGEAVELRYTSTFTAAQFQGLFMEVRTDVANTSTIRAAELRARQGAAVNVGGLEGANVSAFVASTTTGVVTSCLGLSGEAQVQSTFTGTITLVAALRGKVQKEDGATYTAVNSAMSAGSFGVLLQSEFVTGAAPLTAAIGVTAGADTVGFNTLIDARGTRLTQAAANRPIVMIINDAGTLFALDINTGTGAWTATILGAY